MYERLRVLAISSSPTTSTLPAGHDPPPPHTFTAQGPAFAPLGGASNGAAWRTQYLRRLAGPVFAPLGGASVYAAWPLRRQASTISVLFEATSTAKKHWQPFALMPAKRDKTWVCARRMTSGLCHGARQVKKERAVLPARSYCPLRRASSSSRSCRMSAVAGALASKSRLMRWARRMRASW